MPNYTVQQGDCLSSIAEQFGLTWQVLWNDPNNADLKELRKTPNILYPGDVVFVPDKRPREAPLTVATTNTFQLKNIPARISIQLFWNGVPRRNEPYELKVAGKTQKDKTDEDGRLSARIPPGATEGTLTIGEGPGKSSYQLKLGELDPASEKSGQKGRLANLGYLQSLDANDDETDSALRSLLSAKGVDPSSATPEQAEATLRSAHET